MRFSKFFNSQTSLVSVCLVFFLLQSYDTRSQTTELTFEQRLSLFSYDEANDFGIREVGRDKRGDITIRDITFVGIPETDSVEAYIVEPAGSGPFAGILWGHWLGHHTSNRDQYLEEAVALASKGVVSVLINAMWSDPSWYQSRVLEEDYENSIKQVIELRRAMDLLISHDKVDTRRIGFVGHDYSGMYGAIAEGIDPRAKTYVFIAVTSSLYDWAFLGNQAKSKYAYVRQNAVFELTDFVSRLKGSVLCQFSTNDPFISKTDGNVFFNALTTSEIERKRYDAGHFMEGVSILTDRTEWLLRELNLD